MPTYRYECQNEECGIRFDDILKVSESENVPCQKCSGRTIKILFPVGLNFPGDGWVSKNLRINKQMRKKNEKLDARQDERKYYDRSIPTLVPNVNGERVDSWSDAQKLAKDKGLETKSYEPLVSKEATKK